MAETVTIGDKDVEIRETEDGFEAVEAEPDDDRKWLRVNGKSTVYVPSDDGVVVHSEGCSARHTRICVLGDELVRSSGMEGRRVESRGTTPHDTYGKEFGWWVGSDANIEIVDADSVPGL